MLMILLFSSFSLAIPQNAEEIEDYFIHNMGYYTGWGTMEAREELVPINFYYYEREFRMPPVKTEYGFYIYPNDRMHSGEIFSFTIFKCTSAEDAAGLQNWYLDDTEMGEAGSNNVMTITGSNILINDAAAKLYTRTYHDDRELPRNFLVWVRDEYIMYIYEIKGDLVQNQWDQISELDKMVTDMLGGGDEVAPEKEGETAIVEEKVEEEVKEVNIDLENNPETNQPFVGVVADGTSKIGITINSSLNSGTLKVKEATVGKLEIPGFTNKIDLPAKDIKITYVPPEYLGNEYKEQLEGFTKDFFEGAPVEGWYIPVEVTLVYTPEEGEAKEFTKVINIYRPPVILVHGFTGDASTWEKLDVELVARKYDTTRKEYYYWDQQGQSITVQSKGLANDIKQKKKAYKHNNIKIDKVDIVAHSMGGLITRYYLEQSNYYNKDIRKLIMVGTPNHGCSKIDFGIGWYQAYVVSQEHVLASEQLYGENEFIRKLNENEMKGTHLNRDVQYGLIFGYGFLGGDMVVTKESANLNGVYAQGYEKMVHSPVFESLGPSITLDSKVFDNIYLWLEKDIPKGHIWKSKIQVYSVEGEAFITNKDDPDNTRLDNFRRLDETSTDDVGYYQAIKTGLDGKVRILLSVDNMAYGYVDLDSDTYLMFEFVAPDLIQVYMIWGTARFNSTQGGDKHFRVVLEDKYKSQVIRGLSTDFVVNHRETSDVYVIEGSVEMRNGTEYNKAKNVIVGQEEMYAFGEGSEIVETSYAGDAWWEEGVFSEETPVVVTNIGLVDKPLNTYLNKIKELTGIGSSMMLVIIGGAIVLLALILLLIIIKGIRKVFRRG